MFASALSSFRELASGKGWMRGLGVTCAVILSLSLVATDADARSKHHRRTGPAFTPKAASLVMDAYTGRILYSNNADAQCYPASLTKVMTLYLLFEQLHAGKVTLRTRMPVSYHASAQAPSRLGLRAGETISVEDAILALVTKSANDVAVTVAEYLGGTEKQFAARMTSKAHALGMNHTQYMNASGLPNKNQLITARDMATLAKRIQLDFPQYYHYFSTEEFAWDGRVIRNHNHLLGKYEGVNGLKTGYTAASGFNLTTSVWRDNKSIIGVVLGGKTARARDLQMVSILDRAMPGAVAMRDTGTRLASAMPAPRSPAGISNDDRNALAALASTEEPDPDEESYTGTDQVASLTSSPPSVKMSPVADDTADDDETPAAAPVAASPAVAETAAKPVVTAAALPAAKPVAAKPAAAPLRLASAEPGPLGVLPALRPAEPIAAAAATTDAPMVPAHQAAAPLDHATAYALAAFSQAEGPARRIGRDLGSLIVTPAQASEGPLSTPAVGLRNAVNEAKQPVPQHGWQAGDPLIPEGSWVIQIGAYADQADAVDRIRSAIRAAPAELGKAVPVTLPVKTADNRTLYRSRFGGFDDEKEARNACGRLARESISCVAIPPANWAMPASAVAKEKARS